MEGDSTRLFLRPPPATIVVIPSSLRAATRYSVLHNWLLASCPEPAAPRRPPPRTPPAAPSFDEQQVHCHEDATHRHPWAQSFAYSCGLPCKTEEAVPVFVEEGRELRVGLECGRPVVRTRANKQQDHCQQAREVEECRLHAQGAAGAMECWRRGRASHAHERHNRVSRAGGGARTILPSFYPRQQPAWLMGGCCGFRMRRGRGTCIERHDHHRVDANSTRSPRSILATLVAIRLAEGLARLGLRSRRAGFADGRPRLAQGARRRTRLSRHGALPEAGEGRRGHVRHRV